jgi:hypothetical protein
MARARQRGGHPQNLVDRLSLVVIRSGATGFASVRCGLLTIDCSIWQDVNEEKVYELLFGRVEQVPACTRPFSIDSLHHDAASDRVLLDEIAARV